MDLNAKRYARRILLIHLLVLTLVLAAVAGAAWEIYIHTREQMIRQALDTQMLLAKQTTSGIEGHYQSILSDLDLMHSAEMESDDEEVPEADRPALSLSDTVADQAVNTRGPIVGQVMWRQLKGHVSLLFAINHGPVRILTDPRRRPPTTQQLTAMAQAAKEPHVIGRADLRVTAPEVMARLHNWIDGLAEPSLSPFDTYNGVGVNVICIPLGDRARDPTRGRDLIAVVPIHGIEKQFLQPLSEDPGNGAWLIDEAGTAMAASRAELVGTNTSNIADPELFALAKKFIGDHASGTEVMNHSFQIGQARFAPSMITAMPVTVGNKKWELFVTTSLDHVDGIVARLMHRALIWCIFVVLSVTAILVSTAVQMIRARLRMERLRHETLERELGQARQIQLAWLPHPHPVDDGIEIAAINSPASHVSGDFYNWFDLPDGRMVITVGDVTGHGMSAAFLMATTQLLVRNTMVRLGDPGRCLEEVNRQLCVQVFNGQFVTMLVLIVDVKEDRLQIATAGHPAPLIASGESFQPIPLEPQLVLGVDRETKYITENFKLPPRASILLYTDGVVECPDAKLNRFGNDRLRRTLYGQYDSAQAILDRVVAAVDGFRGGQVLADDLTMVAVQMQSVTTRKPDEAAVGV